MQQFRTTVSAVFWTDTPDASEAAVAAINALLPPEDQVSTLATVEYVADGRPDNLPQSNTPMGGGVAG